jgi:hypothetical protein
LMSCEECCAEYWMPPHVIAKHLGRFCSVECKAKWMSRTYTGEGSPMWKGDRVSYSVLHHWVVRHRGKADHCAFDPSHKPKYYDWANKSGQYLRDLDDWIPCADLVTVSLIGNDRSRWHTLICVIVRCKARW